MRPPVYRDVAERFLATMKAIGASEEALACARKVAAEAVERPAPEKAPDPDECRHDAWEELGGGARRCADCGEWLRERPTVKAPAPDLVGELVEALTSEHGIAIEGGHFSLPDGPCAVCALLARAAKEQGR